MKRPFLIGLGAITVLWTILILFELAVRNHWLGLPDARLYWDSITLFTRSIGIVVTPILFTIIIAFTFATDKIKTQKEAFTTVQANWEATTQQQQLQFSQTQAKSEEAWRNILSGLDHELKNPVQIIRLSVSNLQHSTNLTDEQQATLQRLQWQAHRLERMVSNLRRLNDLEAINLEYEPTLLQDILEEARDLVAASNHSIEREIVLSVQSAPKPLQIIGDRELLIVAFRNLLENACKYTQAEDRIELLAVADEQKARIIVADAGFGITQEEQPRIFENGFRGEDVRGIGGRGFGLHLVDRIIQLHQGEIIMQSQAEEGTIFTIWLPLANSLN